MYKKRYEIFFSHDTGSDSSLHIGRLDFFVPLLFFDTLPLYTNVYTVTAESIEIDSEISFLFSTNRLDTPMKIDTSIYYTKVPKYFYDFIYIYMPSVFGVDFPKYSVDNNNKSTRFCIVFFSSP